MSTTRRQFVSQTAAALAAPAFLTGQTSDRPPNIVYVICDQMRGDAMRFLGHPDVRTPNIDRMARQGVTFERCFVNNPVCIPSRKSAFSGRYPHQHGSLTNNQKPLLSWSDTLAEQFDKAGYRTGWVGKNHTYENKHVDRVSFKSIRSREPFRAYNGYVPPHWHTDVYWPEEDCYPEVNTREALRFLDEAKGGDPFFLHVSYFDPHPPYMAPSDFSANYVGRELTLPPYVPARDLSERLEEYKHAFGMDRVTRDELTETMRYYYAQIEWGVDKQVGRLLDALQERGLSENTVVVFTSDHGDFMGTNGLVRKGMFLYDSLLHVPMIWHAPGRFRAGLRTKAMAQHIDLFPTLCDFAGIHTASLDLPGRSLRPWIEQGGEDDPGHEIYTSAGYDELTDELKDLPLNPAEEDGEPRHSQVMERNMNPRYRQSMVRTADWKMIMTETRGPELYAMNGGVAEPRNVAHEKEHAGARAQLEKKLGDWWKW